MMNITTFLAQASDYSTNYSYSDAESAGQAAAAIAAIGMLTSVVFFLMTIVTYVITSVCLMKIFKKAGREDAWAAWVPFYNVWRFLEIGGQPGFWSVLAVIPVLNIVSIVFMFIAGYNIGLKLGKSGMFVLLMIFLGIVWYIWLAFDKSIWNEDAEGAAASLIPVTPAPVTTPTPAATPASPQQ